MLACILALLLQDPDIAALLEKLKSDRVEVRDEATRRLIDLGPAARPAVQKLVDDPDTELSQRAAAILVAMNNRIERLLPTIAEAVEQWQKSPVDMVRAASGRAIQLAQGREWRDLRKLLRNAEVPLDFYDNTQSGETYTSLRGYLLRRAAYSEGGFDFDLILSVDILIDPSETEPTRNRILTTRVFLRHRGLTPTRNLLGRNPFPEGTILHRLLDLAQFQEKAAGKPLLSGLRIALGEPRGAEIRATLTSADGEYRDELCYRTGLDAADPLTLGPTWVVSPGKSREWDAVEAETLAIRAREPKQDVVEESRVDVYSLPDLRALPDSATIVRLRWSGLKDEHLPLLARAANLAELNLTSTHITEKGFAHLKELKSLRHLTLYSCQGITDLGCGVLSEFPQLSFLHVSDCAQVTDEGLRLLAKTRGLKTLVLGRAGDSMTDQGILALKALPGLEELRLWSIRGFSNAGAAGLADFPALRHLLLAYLPKVDDDGLRFLSKSKTLQHLELIELPITDAGVIELKGLTRPLSLRINQCENVTRRGVDEFVNAQPGKWIVK